MEKMQKAAFNLGKVRTVGEVVKPNPLTTLVRFDPFDFSEEEKLELMVVGYSFNKLVLDMEEAGITHEGIIKRHNIKHSVVFI